MFYSRQHLALEWPQKNLGSKQRNKNGANKIIQQKFTRLFETETNISRNYSQLALVPEEYDDLNILTEATIYYVLPYMQPLQPNMPCCWHTCKNFKDVLTI